LKKWGLIALSGVLLALVLTGCEKEATKAEECCDTIIYGGGTQAVAAALQYGAVTRNKSNVLMIVPERALGSILSLGKQNLFDVNYYESKKLPKGIPAGYQGSQAGSLRTFLGDISAVFPPEEMERYLARRLGEVKRLTILYEHDLTEVETAPDPDGKGSRVTAVKMRKLIRDERGHYIFDPKSSEERLQARVFIDASETGRLVQLSGHHVGTVGREDQNSDRLQMAATLMFKLKGIDSKTATKNGAVGGQAMSPKGSFQFWGGYEMETDPVFLSYEQASHRFRMKPYNAGEEGFSGTWNSEKLPFWMNMLLIYNVDANKSKRYSSGKEIVDSSAVIDPETALDLAKAEIANPEFIQMLRRLPGFERAELVRRADGSPEVGETLYIRESIHTANFADPVTRTYRFALDRQGVSGGDGKYFARRIGLGYYHFDSNSYKKGEQLSNPLGNEPWYVPYDTLLEPKITNVLVPGYAANMDSFAWTAMRVYPNLIMLGDAAGTAAAMTIMENFNLHQPSDKQIEELQDNLRKANVILDK
jgi:hypothetical protein